LFSGPDFLCFGGHQWGRDLFAFASMIDCADSQSLISQCNNWVQAKSEAALLLKSIVDCHSDKMRDDVTFKT
jgi:hypothetical protein